MQRLWRTALILLVATQMTTQMRADGFDPDLFKKFIELRAGTGEPVYWYCIGEVYSYPDGRLLARMEGIDTARALRDPNDPLKVVQLNRKIFIYRDPRTNEVLRKVGDQIVRPIAYPYQMITYELRDGQLVTWVEQGAGRRRQRLGPGTATHARRIGDRLVFSSPLFINLDGPLRYEAYENYDFWYEPNGAHHLSWNRFGTLPPFFGGGQGVFQLVCRRVTRYADLPATIRDYLEREAPLWREPPKDLTEIRRLQSDGES